MRRLWLGLLICLFSFGMAWADDPGQQDSVIIQHTDAPLGADTIYVWIFTLTDDSVVVYNIPLRFTSSGSGITYAGVTYYPPLTQWQDCFDSFCVGLNFLRFIGWHDIGGPGEPPPLMTNYNRHHTFNLKFAVADNAEPQVVHIDTTWDPNNGSLFFGLRGGVVELTPAFVGGDIYYGPLAADDELNLPSEFSLAQNYPNPFNSSTTINFALPRDSEVQIEIYNILGEKEITLLSGQLSAGYHSVIWEANDMPSGIYFYRINTGDFSQAKKMTLVK